MYSSDSEASGSVRGNDAVEAMTYTIQVHFDEALRDSFSVSKALSVHDKRIKIHVQLSQLHIEEDSALLDSLKITKTQGGEQIPVPDQVKTSTVDLFQRMAALSSMLSETIESNISLWFKAAGGQVTPATHTPQVKPQNIEKPLEKDQEFIRLYVDRLANYLVLDNTACSKALATVMQCCVTIIINDDSKNYSVIEHTLNSSQTNCQRRSKYREKQEQSNEKAPLRKRKHASSNKVSSGSFSVHKDGKFMVAPCTFTVLKLRQLLSNLSRIQAKKVYNIFTDIAVQVLSELACDCNWKPADLSDSLLQAFLLDKVPSLHTL